MNNDEIRNMLHKAGESIEISSDDKAELKSQLIRNIRLQRALSPFLQGLFRKQQEIDTIFEKLQKSS